jgi:hypothetical protein
MVSLKINQSEHQIAQESIKILKSEDNGGVSMFWVIIIIIIIIIGSLSIMVASKF